ncbi:phospho-N-acetylmuramoyl-pentapeptide-transferase [Candidatus Gracilibacteria bacterium]|nr:phospho-N-acetylmuramoyl-pentapeptide-transferase [Candidatus Gracilibacteria bacterium]
MIHSIFILSALLVSFLLTLVIMPYGIRLFIKWGLGKNIRSEGLVGKAKEFEKLHSKKKGTPNMGGALMIFTVILVVLLSIGTQILSKYTFEKYGFGFQNSLWNRKETYLVIFTLVTVGIIGFVDDYLNVKEIGRTKGLSARVKMICLILFSLMGAYWFYVKLGYSSVNLPFFGDIQISIFYVFLFVLVVISAANSVNLTDGLDGLAGGLLLFQYLAYGGITYMQGTYILSAFCMIIAGTLMAFLWFNIHPAQIFMGDVGSLSLGATLAIIALMTDTLLAFIIMSSVFIAETISVMMQTTSKKMRNGKKIFRIAPFHHHLEAIGWQEETIVMRLWILGIVSAIVGIIVAIMGA